MGDPTEVRCSRCNKLLFVGICSGEFKCSRCGAREKHTNIERWATFLESGLGAPLVDSERFNLFESFRHLRGRAKG